MDKGMLANFFFAENHVKQKPELAQIAKFEKYIKKIKTIS